jgi:hypothetical protein
MDNAPETWNKDDRPFLNGVCKVASVVVIVNPPGSGHFETTSE